LGSRAHYLEIKKDGTLDLDNLYGFIEKKRPKLIALMALNNETGIVQPWEEVLRLCKNRGILFLCDASQWIGKLPLGELGKCDFIIGSAHKFGGPKGVGFLKIPDNFTQFRISVGGGQEMGHRSGTEDYPAIAAMVAAYQACRSYIEKHLFLFEIQKTSFEKVICMEIPGTRIVGQDSSRVWNTVGLIMPKFNNVRWIAQLSKRGFCVASGSACASKKEASSPVLSAMGYTDEEAKRFIRVSSGWQTTEDDWKDLLEGFISVWEELNQSGSGSQSTVIDL